MWLRRPIPVQDKSWEKDPRIMPDSVSDNNRRRRPRVNLNWAIRLRRNDGELIAETATDNLSSEGFHCTLEVPLSPGETLRCELLIPTSTLVLYRSVRVVRVDIRGLEPGFGIACRFEPSLTVEELQKSQAV